MARQSQLPGQQFSNSVDLDWHLTPEGLSILSQLRDPNTGLLRQFGYLESPNLPSTIPTLSFKLALVGRSGVGKTALSSYFAGNIDWCSTYVETPGIRVSDVYWPVKLMHSKLLLFKLVLWDSGESSSKKYSHINAACHDNADGTIFVFSFTSRQTFDDLEIQISKLRSSNQKICPIVIGVRYGLVAETQVTQADVVSFESKWNLSVLRIRNNVKVAGVVNTTTHTQNEITLILNLICDQLYSFSRQHRRTDSLMI